MTLLKQTTVTRADDSLTISEKDDDLQTDCCTLSLTSGSLDKELRTLTISDPKSVKNDQSCESGIESLSASCSLRSSCTDRSEFVKQGGLHSLKQDFSAYWTDRSCSKDETSLADGGESFQTQAVPDEETQRHSSHSSQKKDKGGTSRALSDCWNELCKSFPDKDGDTLLHLAVLQTVTHLAHLVRLLGLRGQVNRRNSLYQTPLHLAVLTANRGAVSLLKNLPGASLHLQDCRGNTPLHTTCLRNDPRALSLLLLEDEDLMGDGSSDGEGLTGLDVHHKGDTSTSSGSECCKLNDCSNGKMPFSQLDYHSKASALSSGVYSESLQSDREEPESPSRKEIRNERVDGCSSADSRRQERSKGALDDDDVDDDDEGKTVCGDYGEMDKVHEEEAKEEEDPEGRRRRQRREVKIALCLKNYEGLTCLHLAVLQGNAQLVALLLRHGADVNARDGKSGRTALHLAVDTLHPSSHVLSTLLLHPDLHINATNFAQQTALQLARGRHHLELVDLLHMRGARWSDSIHGYYSSSSDSFSDDDVEEDLFVPYDDIRVAGQLLTARCQV